MNAAASLLLVGGVVAVGVLHTIVPDHWLPIVLLARQQGWSRGETISAAARAGTGHVASTLAIGIVVWLGGAALAERFGAWVDIASSIALIAFGGWIAIAALREQRSAAAHSHDHRDAPHRHHHDHHRSHDAAHHHDFVPAFAMAGATAPLRHIHLHRHGDGAPHQHWHEHSAATAHEAAEPAADAPPHDHPHPKSGRTALLLILGSSPMVEGIPAFFAAAKYGAGLILVMAAAFALSTIATYISLCAYSAARLQRLRLGRFERYGEVLSGGFIAAIGVVFGVLAVA